MNKSALLLDRAIGRRLVRTGGHMVIQRVTRKTELEPPDNDERKKAWEARMQKHRKTIN